MTDSEAAFERYVSAKARGVLNLDALADADPVLVEAEKTKDDFISLARLQETLDHVHMFSRRACT